MTRDDIIRMAREAWVLPDAHIPNVLEFANLVAATALRARLAQPEPEPVAWMYQHEDTGLTMCVVVQQVEPGFEENNPRWQKIAPLYTAPPQRVWQGLTDEEIENCFEMSMFGTCRAIEAKLKEKNNG